MSTNSSDNVTIIACSMPQFVISLTDLTFRANTEYKMTAYCVKLDKVPGLSDEKKAELRKFHVILRQIGIHNVP